MHIELNKKKILIWTYVVLSASYVLYSLATDFRDIALRGAYESGKAETLAVLIGKISEGQCVPMEIFAGDKKATLIEASCKSASDGAKNPTN